MGQQEHSMKTVILISAMWMKKWDLLLIYYSYKGKVEDEDWTAPKRIEIVNDVFSSLEKERLKGSKFTILLYIDSNLGQVSEVEFQFSSFWPCATIPLSVYRKIETELKKNIWFTPTAEGKN
ncbi:DUF5043 domain-containing protein [Bacteroides congonensis]|uniref:DUF5043 domain-containing protein n=2 Tax=Bacteroides congonensis TaxID=1871006 RepID=UPI000AF185A9|nr:DUF5043 domain-containing protein [Bacteroides congonensis]